VNDHLHASFATQQSKNRGEQSGPPKSAIRCFLEVRFTLADIGDLGRYPLLSITVTNEAELNPYDPATSHSELVDLVSQNVHKWNGHEISIVCRTDARTLWIESIFIAIIDSTITFKQPIIRFRQRLNFRFMHKGRLIEGNISHDEILFSTGMRYNLNIDGVLVAESVAPIQNWWLGFFVIMAVSVASVVAIIIFITFE